MLWAVSDSKEQTAIVLGATIICAVRTGHDEAKQSPKVMSVVSDSIRLARMLWERTAGSDLQKDRGEDCAEVHYPDRGPA